jgi:hypothetical protein
MSFRMPVVLDRQLKKNGVSNIGNAVFFYVLPEGVGSGSLDRFYLPPAAS